MNDNQTPETTHTPPCCGGPMMRCHPVSARAVLDRRYAEGKLTKEEYESMKRDLERA